MIREILLSTLVNVIVILAFPVAFLIACAWKLWEVIRGWKRSLAG